MCKGKAQNRIDYIVLHQPVEAARIIEKYGYEAPTDKHELSQAVRLLVKRKGEPVIKDLILIHPEKKLILELTGHQSEESNFCGCHSSYSGDTKDLLDHLSTMSVSDLTKYYEQAKQDSKDKPTDKIQMAQVETVWDELKRRKKQAEQGVVAKPDDVQSYWMKLGFAFLAGIVIAKIA